MTAALRAYQRVKLPLPWKPSHCPEASTEPQQPWELSLSSSVVVALGLHCLSNFETLSNIHPIIAIAGKGIPFVESLLDKGKGNIVIYYRRGA
ncbi:chaperonin 10-like protein [Penicillium freii]|nr:chaperonin 10-like protein [Penicillium freii]